MAHEPRKYRVTNVSKGLVFVKEIRKALAPGEKREFDGIVFEGTRRLEGEMLKIEDLGPGEKINRFQEAILAVEKSENRRRDITKLAVEKVTKLRKSDEAKPEAAVSELSFDDPLDEIPTKDETKPETDPELEPEPEHETRSSAMDNPFTSAGKKSKKSKKSTK